MNMFRIVPLREAHVQEAADLTSRRYRSLRAAVPALPAVHERAESFAEKIRQLIKDGPGVAAVTDNRLIGFLTGMRISGNRVYVPEWANAVEPDLGESSSVTRRADPWSKHSLLSSVRTCIESMVVQRFCAACH